MTLTFRMTRKRNLEKALDEKTKPLVLVNHPHWQQQEQQQRKEQPIQQQQSLPSIDGLSKILEASMKLEDQIIHMREILGWD